MKKLTILLLLFFFAFHVSVDAQKKVIVLNDHDARYKNNGPRLSGHQDNGNHKNRGLGNVKRNGPNGNWNDNRPRPVIIRDGRNNDLFKKNRRRDDDDNDERGNGKGNGNKKGKGKGHGKD